jgi:lipoprotein-anchoring transpeptidase ErfK/SrfK
LFGRRFAGAVSAALAVTLLAAGCTSNPEVVTVTVTSGQSDALSSLVQAPELSTAATTAAPASAAPPTTTSVSTVPGSNVRITAKPAFGAKNVPPNDPVTVTVFAAKLSDMTMTADDGTQITGAIAADKGSWVSKERLDYATVYTVAGIAQGNDGKQTKITGKITTVKPTATERAAIQIPQGGVVGVGAPIILTFSGVVKNRAAVEKALTVTTSAGAALQGNWGWVQDEQIQADGPVQSQVHWRPTVSPVDGATPYWPANTKVHLAANLKGVDYGGGQWGREDFASDFSIGRSQIVIADASTHHLIVTVDDKITKNYAVSYGKESVPGRGTLNGIHLVTEKYPTFAMCNPQFDYCNSVEKWAVRINNNGEFIHENLKAAAAFGIANVSHGCVNMGSADAKSFYDSAIYGDPVVVTNTGGPQMSEKDALYDWIYTPDEWKALSAL